jgi:UDP-2,3-diacylglucosamine hydrolase
MKFAKKYLVSHPSVDCFIFGHRHLGTDVPLGDNSRAVFLGDWISKFDYVVIDSNSIEHKFFIEGESKDI